MQYEHVCLFLNRYNTDPEEDDVYNYTVQGLCMINLFFYIDDYKIMTVKGGIYIDKKGTQRTNGPWWRYELSVLSS